MLIAFNTVSAVLTITSPDSWLQFPLCHRRHRAVPESLPLAASEMG